MLCAVPICIGRRFDCNKHVRNFLSNADGWDEESLAKEFKLWRETRAKHRAGYLSVHDQERCVINLFRTSPSSLSSDTDQLGIAE